MPRITCLNEPLVTHSWLVSMSHSMSHTRFIELMRWVALRHVTRMRRVARWNEWLMVSMSHSLRPMSHSMSHTRGLNEPLYVTHSMSHTRFIEPLVAHESHVLMPRMTYPNEPLVTQYHRDTSLSWLHVKWSGVKLLDFTWIDFTSLHFISLHFISLELTSLHFTSLHLNWLHFTSLYFTLLHLNWLHFTPLHFTLLHFTSIDVTSLDSTSLYFISPLDLTWLHFNWPCLLPYSAKWVDGAIHGAASLQSVKSSTVMHVVKPSNQYLSVWLQSVKSTKVVHVFNSIHGSASLQSVQSSKVMHVVKSRNIYLPVWLQTVWIQLKCVDSTTKCVDSTKAVHVVKPIHGSASLQSEMLLDTHTCDVTSCYFVYLAWLGWHTLVITWRQVPSRIAKVCRWC